MSKLQSLLEFGIEVLDRREISYWLDCGTLLGAVRDQKLLPWEKDIDIGVLSDDIDHSDIEYIVSKAKEHGCQVNIYEFVISIVKEEYVLDFKMYEKREDIFYEEKLTPKNILGSAFSYLIHAFSSKYPTNRQGLNLFNTMIIKLIQILRKIMPYFLTSLLIRPVKYLYKKLLAIDNSEAVPCSLLDELSKLDFLGKTYSIPTKTEEYLTFRFGEDWRVPKQDWVTARDDGGYILNKKI